MAIYNDLTVGNLSVTTITGAGAVPSSQGKKFYVDPVSGSDGNDGLTPATAFKGLLKAYNACTSGKNDTIYYLASTSATTNLTATLTWAKHYTHLIGVCAPTMFAQRARVFATGAFSPMVNITAQGCIFKDVYFFHGIDSASALVNVQVTGGRNYFENVHFAGIGNATQGDQATACSLKLSGAEENTFKNCTIGIDTVPRSAACAELRLASAATRNVFEGCRFVTFADNAAALWVEANTSGAIDRFTIFKDCTFHNAVHSTATTMNYGMTVHASVGGTMLLDNILWYGATDLQDNNANVIVGRTPAFDAADAGLAAAQTKS